MKFYSRHGSVDNPVDAAIRQGYLAITGDKLPLIPGMDAAGVVENRSQIGKAQGGRCRLCFHAGERRGYAQFGRE
jgi:NADPH:quinone reductase-like Zn-dependent oxidoreductase